jgi:hypothetical protein
MEILQRLNHGQCINMRRLGNQQPEFLLTSSTSTKLRYTISVGFIIALLFLGLCVGVIRTDLFLRYGDYV